VDRFADLMVKDVSTGECFRLDHLIKAHLEKLAADKKTLQAAKHECQDIIVRVITYALFICLAIYESLLKFSLNIRIALGIRAAMVKRLISPLMN
jgi:glycyl-tRNA synthetase (class II)